MFWKISILVAKTYEGKNDGWWRKKCTVSNRESRQLLLKQYSSNALFINWTQCHSTHLKNFPNVACSFLTSWNHHIFPIQWMFQYFRKNLQISFQFWFTNTSYLLFFSWILVFIHLRIFLWYWGKGKVSPFRKILTLYQIIGIWERNYSI